ncbi:MAG: PEP/pyruvate-binding domain-containing protein, partial [Streptosporangiaceae bacterium]
MRSRAGLLTRSDEPYRRISGHWSPRAGIGEALVSGEAGGHRHVVDKATGRPTRDDSPLPPGTLDELTRLGSAVERAFGGPQDIEWTVAAGRCALVQARP